MKKILIVLFVLLGVSASAYDFSAVCSTGQTLYYTITSDSTVNVTYPNGYGSYYSGYTKPSGILSIPDTVNNGTNAYVINRINDCAFYDCPGLTYVEIPNSIISIGDNAFCNCSSLTSVTIPNSVTSIGTSTFRYCNNLDSLSIGSSVVSIGDYAFYNCSSLTSVNIPNSVATIGYQAFSYCSNLDSLFIGSSVTSIGLSAFYGCSGITYLYYNARDISSSFSDYYTNGFRPFAGSLTNLVIGDSVQTIPDYAFKNCVSISSVNIPNSVTYIGVSAFHGCSSLTNVIIPNSVTSVGDYAFCGCNTLTSVIIPNSVTSIGHRAFLQCTNMVSLYIGSAVTSIGDYAFSNCDSLVSITIPNSVTSIGEYAFSSCSNLDSIQIGTGLMSMGEYAFANSTNIRYLYYNARNINSSSFSQNYNTYGFRPFAGSLTNLIIGDSVQAIPYSAFYGCSSLTSVTIPNSVTSIGDYAFIGCSNLDSLYIGSSVTAIGDCAFSGCSTLNNIVIPNSVISIGSSAFYGCSNLNSLYLGSSVTSIGQSAFSGCSSIHYLYYNARNISSSSFTGSGYYYSIGFRPFASSLTNLVIGDSVQVIPNYAFYGCSSLTSVTIPNSVTSIGNCAFENCNSLDSLYIGSSVTSIDQSAFTSNIHYLYYNARNINSSSFSYNGTYGFRPFASSLTNLVIGDSVQVIPNYAFYGCSSLTSVTIPNSVTSIGNCAFANCNSLDSLYIGSSVTSIGNFSFSGCINLGNIAIPNTVISVGQNAFAGCSRVETLNIGSSVTSIGNGAFYYCNSISSVSIPNSVIYIGENAFNGCSSLDSLYIGSSVASIPTNVFEGCDSVRYLYYNAKNCTVSHNLNNSGVITQHSLLFSNLDTLIIGDSVQVIGDHCFRKCSINYDIAIPNSVHKIGSYAFFENAMSSVTLGNHVDTIGDYAFYVCEHITNPIIIPNSVRFIGYRAFSNCDSITSLQFADSNNNLTLGDNAFTSCDRLTSINFGNSRIHIGGQAFSDCLRLNNVNFGNNIDIIGSSAFNNCIRLNMSSLPDSLIYIGNQAFQGCTNWGGTMRIPSNVTYVGSSAFANCPGLDSLIFGESVSHIGEYAFGGDSIIRSITMEGSTPPTIYSNTFGGISDSIPVYIPCNTYLNYYITNYWENFVNLHELAPYHLYVSSADTLFGTARIVQLNTCSDSTARIQALPIGNYHFTHWSDGNTENPRYIAVTQDTHIVAYFNPNIAAITVHSNDSTKGLVTGGGTYVYNNYVTLTANSIGDNHFLKWNDGSTQNPRYLLATGDTSFTAIFVSNISTITVLNSNPTMGTVSGSGNYYYQSQITVSATPEYGYHFTQWNDGNTSNPRNITVVQDSTFTAQFSVSSYSIVANSDNTARGTVTGGGTYNYNSQISLSATANYGYHFVQWNDGNTNNPRLLTVTRDSLFTAQFSANNYTITAATNDPTMGSAYGSGTYSYNGSATLSATATYGYHFVQWSDGNTDNPRLVTVTGDATYTAQFAINTYTLTVNSGNPAIGSAAGGGTYNYNTPVNISATANYGYHFSQWNDGNTNNPRLVTVTQNATFTAQFSINSYAVSVSSNNSTRGSVTGSGSYTYNTTATITATPFYGYHFTQWSDGNTDNPRTFTVTEDASFTAQFDLNNYSVTALSSNVMMGSVTGGGTYSYLSQVSLEAVPSPHYHFVQWNDSVDDNPRTITVVQDTSLTALFQIDQHSVTLTMNDSTRGTVSGTGYYAYNSGVYISATPFYGYHFTQWSDGNTSNPRRITLTRDTTFTAQFVPNTYTANINVNDTVMGQVSGGGSYNYLTTLTLTATANYGYHFVQWSDSVTTNPRPMVLTQDTALTALFAINTYYLTCATNDSTMGSVSGDGAYNYLSQVTMTATPNEHYHFVQWNDGSTMNPRLITLTCDTAFVAQFEEDARYNITVTSNNDEWGTVSGSGTYYGGEQVTLIATPNEHFRFVQWGDGNTQPSRTIQVVSDASYMAIFEEITYTVNVTANDPTMGSVTGSGVYTYGTEITITAQPFIGYEFRSWDDGDTNRARTITVTDDATYQAEFYKPVGIDEVGIEQVVVYTEGRNIVVKGAEGKKIVIYDITGRKVAYINSSDDEERLLMPNAGVYLVRVEGMTARKMVVR